VTLTHAVARRGLLAATAVTSILGLTMPCAAQSSVRCWSEFVSDTESRSGWIVDVAAGSYATAVIRSDGRIFVNGGNTYRIADVPTLGPGLTYQQVAIHNVAAALVSDGTIRTWGSPPWGSPGNAPALPAGLVYDQVRVGSGHVVARRSDGMAIGWGTNQFGESSVPLLPSGVHFVSVTAGAVFSAGLLSNGQVVAWGGATGHMGDTFVRAHG
jgi:large repetitive protein